MELRDLLPDYLLGQLDPQEAGQLEAQLERSPELRAELDSLRAALFKLPERLAPVPPPPRAWQRIQNRLHGRRLLLWPRIATVAAALALLFAGIGLYQFQSLRTLQAEQAKIARWLAIPEGKWRAIKNAQGEGIGTMVWLEDGSCLIVMKDPAPRGRVYQAWGRKDGQSVSLGIFQGRVYETRYTNFERVGVSLEPPGGSPQPTQPLGSVPVSWAEDR
ncbi:anti-sigma factor domain-containing protein [Calidithermus timidus]|jgi:anti-sigma-K factor RskA|uniref:anti-sigma factor n=1 Tax=Calidithermus timidus TaxID=307124 RepID=UPI00036028F1|nr:anti-sigma factor [Calidithermus timidus]